MRVLVVEDMPRHANRIAEGLRDQGIAVDVAYDGHEAISKVNVNPYDVVGGAATGVQTLLAAGRDDTQQRAGASPAHLLPIHQC